MADTLRSRLLAALDQENHGGGITREMAVDAMLEVRDEELEQLRRRAGWHGECVPITKWAEELRDKLNALGQRDHAEAAIARIREQHPEHEGRCARCLEPCTCLDDAEQTPDGLWHAWANVCAHGNADWPCPTIRALDDTPEEK